MAFAGLSGKGGGGGPLRSNRTFRDEFDGQEGCGCIKLHHSQKPKRLSRVQLLKERIRQFSIWYFEEQEHVDKDFFRRRVERHRVKTRHVSSGLLRIMKWLYLLDILAWATGLVFLLCSSIDTFGQYTPFYESKVLFRILGPLIMLLAVCLLLFVTGFKHKVRKKHNKRRGNFYIINKKRGTCNSSEKFETSLDNSKDTSEDSGNEEDIEVKAAKKIGRHKKSKDHNKDSETATPLYFYKNVDSRQCSFELSPLPSTSGMSAQASTEQDDDRLTERSWRDRSAWTKSKWMRMDSEDSIDTGMILGIQEEFVHTPMDDPEQNGEGYDAQYRRQLFKTKSHYASSNDSDTVYHAIDRNTSTKSKISQASTISTCSETAPLVKR